MAADSSLQLRLQQLGDLELAILVSTVAQEHCIFSTDPEIIKDLHEELRLTCKETFGLHPAIVECTPRTTVDEFNEALLIDEDDGTEGYSPGHDRFGDKPALSVNFSPMCGQGPGRFGSTSGSLENRRIADVIIATGLDTASENVQIQAFELLRSKRIFSRSSMHVAPKDLLVLVVLSKPGARLTRHLNDIFCMSHFHAEDDGLPHLEGQSNKHVFKAFATEDFKILRGLVDKVLLTAEMAQYVHNIVVFLRNSRYIKGGVTATATRQLRVLSRALAPLHGMDYVPPSLVTLAVRKIYPHRLVLATHENERSLLWGSDPEAIKELLDGLTVENAIEEVLSSIETPL